MGEFQRQFDFARKQGAKAMQSPQNDGLQPLIDQFSGGHSVRRHGLLSAAWVGKRARVAWYATEKE